MSEWPFPFRPIRAPSGFLRGGKVVANPVCRGVVGAEVLLHAGEGLFVQRDCAPQITRRVVGDSEIVAGGQRGGMVLTEYSLHIGDSLFVQGDRASRVARC